MLFREDAKLEGLLITKSDGIKLWRKAENSRCTLNNFMITKVKIPQAQKATKY